MIPRTDPETRPAPMPAVQVLPLARADQYGNRRVRGGSRLRPVETRNGLPEPRYTYRGAGGDPALDRAWRRDQRKSARRTGSAAGQRNTPGG
jgi:hypothetical protein